MALATANRVVDPCSERAFSEWCAKTAGDRLVKLPAAALDYRRFWDAMDQISETQLAEIERRIVRILDGWPTAAELPDAYRHIALIT